MLSSFFILSRRGDTIISKDCKPSFASSDSVRDEKEKASTFFRKFKKGDCPPVFNIEGINYFYIKKSGMLFVVTSKYNPSASFVFEGLYRCMKVFRDYLGVLSEEAIRKNFILIYELIDEMYDFGHTQIMTTEAVK